jgi:hypothetical protein
MGGGERAAGRHDRRRLLRTEKIQRGLFCDPFQLGDAVFERSKLFADRVEARVGCGDVDWFGHHTMLSKQLAIPWCGG